MSNRINNTLGKYFLYSRTRDKDFRWIISPADSPEASSEVMSMLKNLFESFEKHQSFFKNSKCRAVFSIMISNKLVVGSYGDTGREDIEHRQINAIQGICLNKPFQFRLIPYIWGKKAELLDIWKLFDAQINDNAKNLCLPYVNDAIAKTLHDDEPSSILEDTSLLVSDLQNITLITQNSFESAIRLYENILRSSNQSEFIPFIFKGIKHEIFNIKSRYKIVIPIEGKSILDFPPPSPNLDSLRPPLNYSSSEKPDIKPDENLLNSQVLEENKDEGNLFAVISQIKKHQLHFNSRYIKWQIYSNTDLICDSVFRLTKITREKKLEVLKETLQDYYNNKNLVFDMEYKWLDENVVNIHFKIRRR